MLNCNGSDFVPSVVGNSKGGGWSSEFTMFYDHSILITGLQFLKWNLLRLKCPFIFLLPHRCCRMLEYGEYKGYLYGTSIDAVRTVLDEGKICVIDLEPQVSFEGAGTLQFISPGRKNNCLYIPELLEQCYLLSLVFHFRSWCLLIIDYSLHWVLAGWEYYSDKYVQISIVHLFPSQQLHYQVEWYRNEFSQLVKARIILSCGDCCMGFLPPPSSVSSKFCPSVSNL